jgi:serine phosphatase RsbU (regulator of sigma subunit)
LKLTESLDSVLDYEKLGKYPSFRYTFSLQPEENFDMECIIDHLSERWITILFNASDKLPKKVRNKESTFKIFSTISDIVYNHIIQHKVQTAECIADEKIKLDIYEKLFRRLGNEWNIIRREWSIKATKL